MEINQKNKFCFRRLYRAVKYCVQQSIRDLLSRCDMCQQSCQRYTMLCNTCNADLNKLQLNQYQSNLLNHPLIRRNLPQIHFNKLVALAPYAPPFSQWIGQLKYQGRFEVSNLLADVFSDHLKQQLSIEDMPELLLPVPMHSRRLRSRLYNQSALLGQRLAKRLAIEYRDNVLNKRVNNKQQVGQTGAQRRQYLKSTFSVDTKCALPKHVGLIDDVVTTGATASELAQELKKHGVETVTVLSICLSMPS